jgi:ketosteroid isomerase-like protein
MNRRRVLTGAGASGVSLFGAQSAPASGVASVENAIRAYYAIWEAREDARYRTLVTEDYILLENGKPMTLDEDVMMMPEQGSQRTDRFDFRATRIVGDAAYAHWFLDSTMVDKKGVRTERRWLESGVLRRSGGAWKVALLHSTKIDIK